MADLLSHDNRDEMAIPSYLHPNPLLRWIAWRRVEVLARQFKQICKNGYSSSKPVVMDFGCGTGVLFHPLSQSALRIYGIDMVLEAARLLLEQWDLPKVQLLTPEQAADTLPRQSLDIILAAEVLEHVDPLASTLTFFQDCLKPGGRLLVSLPTENLLYRFGRFLAGFHGHYHHHDAASLDRAIVSSGFIRDRIEPIPLPGPLAIYWIVTYHLPTR